MDNYFDRDPNTGENEINRIQQAIDHDLQMAGSTASGVAGQVVTPPAASPAERADFTVPAPEPAAPAPEPAALYPGQAPAYTAPQPYTAPVPTAYTAPYTPGAAPKPAAPYPLYGGANRPPDYDRDRFYSETVKNQGKSRFKRTLALVCVASVLAPCFLGVGIVAGNYLVNQYGRPVAYSATVTPPEDAAFAFNTAPTQPPAEAPEAPRIFEDRPTALAPDTAAGFANIVDQVEPAVVCITVESQFAYGGNRGFFGMQPPSVSGAGSGIIFNSDAEQIYIVTNYHVVSDADTIQISIAGSDLVPARALGMDGEEDLAVLAARWADLRKAGINDVTVGNFGDSDKMRVGDQVLAIGNALGEGNSATVGIISAKDKQIQVEGTSLTVFQTNAAINPGNSGGPLVNMNGEIIGINSAKLSEASVEGMGYSITSNKAKPIIEEILGALNKPFLGIEGGDVTEQIAALYSLPAMGVIIQTVLPGGPAEQAGLQRGDIITSFNGQPLLSFTQLSAFIQACAPGDKVELKILRNGTEALTVTATLKTRGEVMS
jgi:serine protease Do